MMPTYVFVCLTYVFVCLTYVQALGLSPLRMKMWWRKSVRSTSMRSTTRW